ncbi:bifunctional non-homologous end joining protein LigD [Actinomycetospora succinea]|uniref:DNA ligase (ATP) n=1 Tax=Actinomycetospora succinea TaxID=663603 RepID=A0A4R6VN03_9PSEU|nr:non-homologous end-joining DNA ligase [Actinomycetospora succinea]TDQ65199.1 bifunctional non-homologous end joining protein LigD [Actinomycetospora succinea]
MLATAGEVPTGPGWALELKWDGMRALAYVEGPKPDAVTLVSRNQRAVTGSYPELAAALAETVGTRQVTLDAEVVALSVPAPGAPARPSFDRLQLRMGVVKPSATLRAEVPVTFVAFDVLALDGETVIHRPWEERRRLLEGLGLDAHPRLTTSPWLEGVDPAAALALAEAHGMEGVLAKRRDAPYRSGRTHTWIKTPIWRTVEAVIGGWAPGRGRNHDSLGAVLLGLPEADGRLRYIGHVGTGFTHAARDRMREQLVADAIDDSPFSTAVLEERAARWCAPKIVGEVRFRSWTDDGHLRHPSWRGLRPDRDADELRAPARS